jgi:hypothetical protein
MSFILSRRESERGWLRPWLVFNEDAAFHLSGKGNLQSVHVLHKNITKSKWSPQTMNEFDEISYLNYFVYREINQLEHVTGNSN